MSKVFCSKGGFVKHYSIFSLCLSKTIVTHVSSPTCHVHLLYFNVVEVFGSQYFLSWYNFWCVIEVQNVDEGSLKNRSGGSNSDFLEPWQTLIMKPELDRFDQWIDYVFKKVSPTVFFDPTNIIILFFCSQLAIETLNSVEYKRTRREERGNGCCGFFLISKALWIFN